MTLQNDWRAEIEEMFQEIKEKEQVSGVACPCFGDTVLIPCYATAAAVFIGDSFAGGRDVKGG